VVGVYQAFLIVKRMIQHLASGRVLYMEKVIHEVFRTGDRIGTGQELFQLGLGPVLTTIRRLD